LEDPRTALFHEHADRFAHAPPGSAENLETVCAGNQHCDAVVPYYSDALRKTIKGLKFEAGEIEMLELVSEVQGHLVTL
jgi:hypothetical protein